VEDASRVRARLFCVHAVYGECCSQVAVLRPSVVSLLRFVARTPRHVPYNRTHNAENEEYLGSRILAEVHDLPNQRVIKMDAIRVRTVSFPFPITSIAPGLTLHRRLTLAPQTRAEVKWFRKPSVEERVISVLTFFCKSRGVQVRR
jgi:hypothetical protein